MVDALGLALYPHTMRGNPLAGSPSKVICSSQKAASRTIFHTLSLHFSSRQQVCKRKTYIARGLGPTWSRLEMEFTELLFQQCLKGIVIPSEGHRNSPHFARFVGRYTYLLNVI